MISVFVTAMKNAIKICCPLLKIMSFWYFYRGGLLGNLGDTKENQSFEAR
jgi:hypothetical protein